MWEVVRVYWECFYSGDGEREGGLYSLDFVVWEDDEFENVVCERWGWVGCVGVGKVGIGVGRVGERRRLGEGCIGEVYEEGFCGGGG